MVDVIIIGAGASGVVSAINLKKQNPELNILLLEQNERVLKKLLKTGNGKCNIYNNNITVDKYNDFSLIENNKDKIDLKNFFYEEGLIVKEMDAGRVYPYSESASSVVNILLNSINKYNISLKTNYKVNSISKKNNIFIINNELECKYLIVSTGSKSQEVTNGYELLQSTGHSITKLSSGLVNLITKEKTISLKGVRVKCVARVKNVKIAGELLFKENGLSGIIAFDLSRYVNSGDVVSFDLAPEYSKYELVKLLDGKEIETYLMGLLPKMISLDVLKRANSKNANLIVDVIKNYKFTILEKGSFDNSQITIGGVCLEEIDNNFMSKKVDNLYITGEVLNVDGACGGYNLYFAFLSGIIASNNIIKDKGNL